MGECAEGLYFFRLECDPMGFWILYFRSEITEAWTVATMLSTDCDPFSFIGEAELQTTKYPGVDSITKLTITPAP